MKKILLFVACIALSLSAFSQGILFETDHNFDNALAKAKKENKLIFLDGFASWCGPCKMMASKVFTQKVVGDYFNANFINMKLDMEAPENLAVAKKYEVKAFPTLLFINGDGQVVHRGLGGMSPEELVELGKKAGDTENNTLSIENKIKNGDRSYGIVSKYFELNPYSDNNEKIAIEYLTALPADKYAEKENWEIFAKYVNDPASAPFKYFLDNRAVAVEKFGQKMVDYKIMNMYANMYRRDKANFESYRCIAPETYDRMKPQLEFYEVYRTWNKNKTDKQAWDNFINQAATYMASKDRTANDLNSMAWTVFENYKVFNDKKALNTAMAWAKKGTELAPQESAVLDTYANILYDMGKKKEAIAAEKKAIEMATKANDKQMLGEYQKTLARFK